MPVFYLLVVILVVVLWYGMAKFFTKIGDKAEKSAKPFTDNLNRKDKEGDK